MVLKEHVLLSQTVCECVNGRCADGVRSNGTCTCFSGFTGTKCEEGELDTLLVKLCVVFARHALVHLSTEQYTSTL